MRASCQTSYDSGKVPSSPARAAGCRVAALRTGVVLDHNAPAFQLLSLPFRLGLGGRLGSGTQYFPVISLTDWLRAVRFVAEHDTLSGPVNLSLPIPTTNEEFTQALATALHRPAFIPVPAFLMKAALGEFAWELLGSKPALPTRLQSNNFTFHHPTAPTALSAALLLTQFTGHAQGSRSAVGQGSGWVPGGGSSSAARPASPPRLAARGGLRRGAGEVLQ